MSDITPYLKLIASGAHLSREQTRAAFDLLLEGKANDTEIAGLLMGLRARGETAVEIAAAADAMRSRAIPVHAPDEAIDVCGTGGDGAETFNISTAAAFIAAGAGVVVAKHGNKAASSKSGSSEILSALGVNLSASPETIARCISEANVGFMFAAFHHGAVANVAPVRQALGVRTIFNLLGPLSNPAKAKRQLMGVFDKDYQRPVAEALRDLGTKRAWIVHGADGLDELTTTTTSYVVSLDDGVIDEFEIAPEDAGLTRADPLALKGGDPEENAVALRAVLNGEKNAYRDIAILNAAGALMVADLATDLRSAAVLAAQSIDNGSAAQALNNLVRLSNISS